HRPKQLRNFFSCPLSLVREIVCEPGIRTQGRALAPSPPGSHGRISTNYGTNWPGQAKGLSSGSNKQSESSTVGLKESTSRSNWMLPAAPFGSWSEGVMGVLALQVPLVQCTVAW